MIPLFNWWRRRLARPNCSVLVLVLGLAGFPGWAATNSVWSTRVWQTDDGLPDNQVAAVMQGPDGYLWVGTAVALARFDGLRFTDFSYSETANHEDQGVSTLVPAQGGGMWIRTRHGTLVGLNPDFSRARLAARNLPVVRTFAAIEDRQGCLWVLYPDEVWKVKAGQVVKLTNQKTGVPSGTPNGLVADAQGILWLAKGNEVGILRDGKYEAITNTYYKPHLAASRTAGIWLATGKELVRCLADGQCQDCGTLPASLHAGSSVLMEDRDGAVWVGTTSDGLFRYSESGFEKVPTSHPDILSLAQDSAGNIWVGTAGGGLDRISTRGIHLEGLMTDASLDAIQAVCEDTNGMLWGATQNGVLVSRIQGEWRPVLTNQLLMGPVNSVAADRKGGVWIGTRDYSLHYWHNGQLTTWGITEGLAGRSVLMMLPTTTGDLWVAGIGPSFLQHLHDGRLSTIKLSKSLGRITALAEDAAGSIWVASEDGKLMRIEGDRLAGMPAFPGSFDRAILCLYPTPDGALWIGYGAAGLGRLKDGHFLRISSREGLFDDYISQIVAGSDGWFWFGSEHGIFKVQRSQLEQALAGRLDHVESISYGRNEGLFSVEADSVDVSPFVSPGALESRDGRLWIPLRKALAVLNPRSLRVDLRPPPVLFSQVVVDGQTIASYGGVTDGKAIINLMAPDVSLRLPPSHRHLQFDFTAINLSAPENIRFRYQLVGFDNDWIEAANGRMADYSRLPAGDYRFRVEAANSDGPWGEAPATLAFSVSPFFWQTWWFRLGALGLFTSCVIALVRYISFRRIQAEMRLIEQRAALDKERTRIARDLHDDLGCSLNKVALTLDMAQRGLDAAELVNGKIQHCSDMVRQVAKSVDEIVWAINPRNDTLRYMVDYISQFAVEFLHAAGIACRVDLPDSLPDRLISPEARHNLFLVVKEALNNIARHARASEVHLRAAAAGNQVILVIEDNGRGFEQVPDNASCDGLRNMRQRMEEIGGRFQLESHQGAGTQLSFIYPLPPDRETPGNPNMPYPSAPASRKY